MQVGDGAAGTELGVAEIVALLEGPGATSVLSPEVPVSQLEHALQVAALLARDHPGDEELGLAGLVHDIGQLVPGATDERHAVEGAAAVRALLGERVAGIVALHVEAKRYLVATEGYGVELSSDSVLSLGRQGGALTADEVASFAALPLASDAVTLRRADDHGKTEGLEVPTLASWVPVLEAQAARQRELGPA
jgi:predicted HD phosphohydrolase